MFSFLRIIDHFQQRTLIILLLAIGFLTYLNTLPNQFLWDDEEQIVANPTIRHVSNLPQLFLMSTGTAGGTDAHNGFYRPLMFIAYLINYQFWGLKAWGFHLFQVLVHLINLVLFFLILRHLLNHQKIKYHQALPFLISLLFAVQDRKSVV